MLPVMISALLQPEAGTCGVGLGSRETKKKKLSELRRKMRQHVVL